MQGSKRLRVSDAATVPISNSQALVLTTWPFLSLPDAAAFRRVCRSWNHYGSRSLAQEVTRWFLEGLDVKNDQKEIETRTAQLNKFSLRMTSSDWAEDAKLLSALETDKPQPNWSTRLAAFMKACCGICTRKCGKSDTMTFANNTLYDLSHVCRRCERRVAGPGGRKSFRRIDELTTSGVSLSTIAPHWCFHKPDDEDPTNPAPRDVILMWSDEFDLRHRAAVANQEAEAKRLKARAKAIVAAQARRKKEAEDRKKAEAKARAEAKAKKETEEDKARRREEDRVRRQMAMEEKAKKERQIARLRKALAEQQEEHAELQARLDALSKKLGVE